MIINKQNIYLLHKENLDEEGFFLLVNKPKKWTSFDVVKKVRTHFKFKKVGHAGTLDPNAEGLMIIATGKSTKQISIFSELEKEYIGKMILGAKTPSYDTETDIIETKDYSHINKETLQEIFLKFTGDIIQYPPMYSAVKYRGKPLYKYARKGRKLNIDARKVKISTLELLEFSPPEVKFRVICSKGTYVRSLVNDIGETANCGAYLSELVRTRIGEFKLDEAITMAELINKVEIVDAIN